MSAPLVSVVLPTLNRSELLPRSIGSVLAQTFRDLELIVVDDGSSEELKPIIEAFRDPRLRYIRRNKSGGPAAARNTGVSAARGKFIAFQDSDDEWLLDKLHIQVAALTEENNHQYSGVVSGLLRVSSRGLKAYLDSSENWPNILDESTAIHNATRYVHSQCWLLVREKLEAAGPFDESLRLWDDWDLLIRIARHRPLLLMPKPLTISYRSADSVTAVNPRWADCLQHIIENHRRPLATKPHLLSVLWYAYARLLCLQHKWKQAAITALKAIRLRPLWPRPWLFLSALALGNEFARKRLRTVGAGSPKTPAS